MVYSLYIWPLKLIKKTNICGFSKERNPQEKLTEKHD